MGFTLAGLAELLERVEVPVHVNTHEALWVSRVTGIPMSSLTAHEHGDKVSVGAIDIELLHTPGHTPGSQCFLLDGRLVAGDTLFLDGCGRTDFPPGGDVDEMFRSLQQLAALSGDPTVFPPGHWYSIEPSAALSEVKRSNYVYKASNLDQWRTLMAPDTSNLVGNSIISYGRYPVCRCLRVAGRRKRHLSVPGVVHPVQ